MESRNIIIILVIVVVVLAAAVGAMFLSPSHAKEDSKLTIASNETLYEGDNLTVKLTAINGTAIPDQTVRVTITNESESYESSVITNGSGIGVLELDEDAGNYSVNCSYGGNDKYAANNASQKLVILKEGVGETHQTTTESQNSSNSSSGSGLHYDEEINVYYNDEGIVVDPDGKHPMEAGSKYSDLAERREKWERGELEM